MEKLKTRRMVIPEVEREKVVELANNCILSEAGKPAIQYLKSDVRHFDDIAIDISVKNFKTGYMPEHIVNSSGNRHEFAGRIIFPIYDSYGELIALSSRDFKPNARAKFFHESFVKRSVLYGLNIAKEHIVRKKMAIVVEGEFDVQYLHSKGFNFTVGILGSALGLSHISILGRYCREIFIVMDGDQAGAAATKRLVDKKLTRIISSFSYYNISLIPVVLPEKTDPDEFIYKRGVDSFVQLLRRSREDNEQMKGLLNGF